MFSVGEFESGFAIRPATISCYHESQSLMVEVVFEPLVALFSRKWTPRMRDSDYVSELCSLGINLSLNEL